ncbi:hypothetical protein WR25_13862 [Diploscapter pachys]|uniref:RNA-dependent RNA polymerase n=1 Tax=Diploscapter pachys TaxID=2018661 RepID=A0A2A2KY81_9BILA|nr:hypothetical protein WR25_13862 [Diploscapter pachys]
MSAKTGVLKFWFPYVLSDDEVKELHEQIDRFLPDNCNIARRGEPNKIGDKDDSLNEPATEVRFDVSYDKSIAPIYVTLTQNLEVFWQALFEIIQALTKKNVKKPKLEIPIITLIGDDFYTKQIVCERKVELSYFEFGNLHDSVYNQHYRHSYEEAVQPRNVAADFESRYIGAHFLFDIRNILTVGCMISKQYHRVELQDSSINRLLIESYNKEERTCKLHFDLSTPPTLYRVREQEAVTQPNGEDIYLIASRFYWRRNIHAELTKTIVVKPAYSLKLRNISADSSRLKDEPEYARFEDNVRKETQGMTNVNHSEGKRLEFYIKYLVCAIISRGLPVKDALFSETRDGTQAWTSFTSEIIGNFRMRKGERGVKALIAALARLVQMIDQRARINDYAMVLNKLIEQCFSNSDSIDLTEKDKDRGIVLICRLVITPTRILLMAPEKMMGNRVVRENNADGSRMLRFTVTDEDYEKCRRNRMSEEILRDTIYKIYLYSVWICGGEFVFIGSSNSQMREGGGYLVEKYNSRGEEKVKTIRRGLGNFLTQKSIAKYLSRHGQCYTSSYSSDKVKMRRDEVKVIKDVVRNGYTFTDGVGFISEEVVKDLAEEFFGESVHNCIPSAFQFRMAGYKGMLAVNPLLDLQNEGNDTKIHCILRESQKKFDDTEIRGDYKFEIVKYSAPTRVALNKPFILILDQNSANTSDVCHNRIKNRILNLLDSGIKGAANAMKDETAALERLNEIPKLIDFRYLKKCGIQFTNDVFFRSLLRASAKDLYSRLLNKAQIPIPADLGRSMLGVVDESDTLEYGQVFIQYTNSMKTKTPTITAKKTIYTGKVLITKNPMVSKGDVRIFEAVDVPDLHHHVDVVVFPQKGERPHPNEMAGSDLDGDEYSVIWDHNLLLERNEEPCKYPDEKLENGINVETLVKDIANFMYEFTSQDTVGLISKNHLIAADMYGLDSTVAKNLAEKQDKAVNFQKCAIPPQPLTTRWDKSLPPESKERNADFDNGDVFKPTYRSQSILGEISRYVRKLESIVKEAEEDISCDDIVVDSDIVEQVVIDHENDEDDVVIFNNAQILLQEYNYEIRKLIDYYGIKSEAELFSGCITELNSRAHQKEADRFAMFTIVHIIGHKMQAIFQKYREKFFEEFGGWVACTELPPPKKGQYPAGYVGDVFKRRCMKPTDDIKKKAVLCYKLAYDEARETSEMKLVSFGWIAYDVLALMKETRVNKPGNSKNQKSRIEEMIKEQLRGTGLNSVHDLMVGWIQANQIDELESLTYSNILKILEDKNNELNIRSKMAIPWDKDHPQCGFRFLELIEYLASLQLHIDYHHLRKSRIDYLHNVAYY